MPGHFTSAFELKIDPKNRLFIPVEVRKSIDPKFVGAAVYVILGPNRVPWLYPDTRYDGILDGVPMKMTPDPVQVNYVHAMFAMSKKLEWDEQGRVVLPEKLLTEAGIEKDVTLAGCGDHLEIWNRAAWDAHTRELWAKIPDIASQWLAANSMAKA